MKILSLFLCLLLLTGCRANDTEQTIPTTEPSVAPTQTVPPETIKETEPPDPIRDMMDQMSLEERVGQLFLVRCNDVYAIEHIQQYHLGGFVLFGVDFQNETISSMRDKLTEYQSAAKIPLLIAVDEEGGTVTRISSNPAFRSSKFLSPRNAYKQGGFDLAFQQEKEKAQLLSSLGINVNLGPVCDITTDSNAFMYSRSLGQDKYETGDFVFATVRAMLQEGVGSCLKHFPGYGNNPDTHTGIAVDSRPLAELEETDLFPFATGIAAECGSIMVSHTIVECMDPELPASLSPAVHRYIREKMGFDGVIVTDDLEMQAITDLYGTGEAAVLAILAGNDLLCSSDYVTQYEAVLAAVLDGRIDIDTLNNAVRNVLEWKQQLGLTLVG